MKYWLRRGRTARAEFFNRGRNTRTSHAVYCESYNFTWDARLESKQTQKKRKLTNEEIGKLGKDLRNFISPECAKILWQTWSGVV